jgi:tocopherol O-methyltransferase
MDTTSVLASPNSGSAVGVVEPVENATVARHYRAKTQQIIERYGPGPAVHYHVGLFRPGEHDTFGSASEIRRRIVSAQEKMLDHAAAMWDASAVFAGRLLDIGCGLGGGSIHWARNYPVDVTAVTNVAEHGALVTDYVAQAGLAHRVKAVVGDFCDTRLDGPFDVAVAVQSAGCMPRDLLFRHVAEVIPAGAFFCLYDVFLVQESWKRPFDEYWTAQIGRADEFRTAARANHFRIDRDEDITDLATEFWVQGIAWAEQMLADPDLPEQERQRYVTSIRAHALMFRGYRDRAYEERILRFQKM